MFFADFGPWNMSSSEENKHRVKQLLVSMKKSVEDADEPAKLLWPFDRRFEIEHEPHFNEPQRLNKDILFIRHSVLDNLSKRTVHFKRDVLRFLLSNPNEAFEFHCTLSYHQLVHKLVYYINEKTLLSSLTSAEFYRRSWSDYTPCDTGEHVDFQHSFQLWHGPTRKMFGSLEEVRTILNHIFKVIIDTNYDRLAWYNYLDFIAYYLDEERDDSSDAAVTRTVVMEHARKMLPLYDLDNSDNCAMSSILSYVPAAYHFAGVLEPNVPGVNYDDVEARYDVTMVSKLVRVYFYFFKHQQEDQGGEKLLNRLCFFFAVLRAFLVKHDHSKRENNDPNIDSLASWLVALLSASDDEFLFTILTKLLRMDTPQSDDDDVHQFVHTCWRTFIESIGGDCGVIIDMLITEVDTMQTLIHFLLTYLKHPPPPPKSDNLDIIKPFLVRLFTKLERLETRRVLPYSVAPLIRAWKRWKEAEEDEEETIELEKFYLKYNIR